MIGVTQLLCGKLRPGDVLRYGRRTEGAPAALLRYSADKRPVVVWNATRRCNLACVHCYAAARSEPDPDELSTEQARAMIDDLAQFGVPVLLFSGGEPLLREDIFELGRYAAQRGIRAVISTNGTLIDRRTAQRIREAGFSYVGVSLDGLRETNDRFRGRAGAFDEALEGIRQCRAAGVRVGLRFTVNRRNFADLGGIFDLVAEERIERLCIYHLVYAGRGTRLLGEALSHEETRQAVDLIFRRAEEFCARGLDCEVLTVDNHADGPYLYLKLAREQPERAADALQLLRWNGGNSSGMGIGCVDWRGDVHPDQFWTHYSLGNVGERPFSEIWTDTSNPLLAGLKNRRALLKGRCAACRFIDICNGNFRVRAEAVFGDVWAHDPACYLTDEEIGVA